MHVRHWGNSETNECWKKLNCLDTWFREGEHLKRALKETKLYGSDVRAMLSANAKARGAQDRPDGILAKYEGLGTSEAFLPKKVIFLANQPSI